MPQNQQHIGQAVARGGIATLVSNTSAQVLRLGATLLMARLLAAQEFGLFAMINSALGIATVLRDMGLSEAAIQSASITNRQHSTLFWINAGLGLLMTVAIVLASPWIARGLGVPDATLLIIALAPVFLLSGLGAQHKALMSRNLAFSVQAKMTFWSVVVSQSLTLALAATGAGIWSLISGAIAAEIIITLWCWRSEPWRPLFVFSLVESRPLLIFGGYVSAFGILSYLAGNLHQLLIGIFNGAAAAGYFNRAIVLLFVPISLILLPIGNVISAALARLQSDPVEFARYYLKIITTVNLLTAPLGIFSLLSAPEIVRVLLGPGWEESGVLLRLMAVSLMLQPLMFSAGWVYRSLGKVKNAFWWGNASWSFILTMYLIGLAWGARGVAAAHSLSLLVLLWPCLHFAFRGTAIKTAGTLKACIPCFVAATLATLPTWGCSMMLVGYSPLMLLIVTATIYWVAYVGLLLVFGEGNRLSNLLLHFRAWASD